MANPLKPVEDPFLDIRKLTQVLWRRRGIVQRVTIVCLLLSTLYGFLWPKTYQTVTTVKVPDSSAQAGANALQQMAFLPVSGDPIETSMQIAMADKVAAGVIQKLNLLSNPEFKKMDESKLIWYLQHQVKVDNVKRSNLLSIAARAKSAQQSADLANAWAQSFIEVNQDLNQESEEARYKFLHGQLNSIREKLQEDQSNKQNYMNQSNEAEADQMIYKSLLEQEQESRIRSNNENTGIVVVDPATVPDKAVSPKKSVSIILGFLVGIFLGVVAAFTRERMEDRIYEEGDLTQAVRADLWASIPFLKDQGQVALLSQSRKIDPEYTQSFKSIRARLLLARPESGSLALGILSSRRAEGRTLIAAHLGLCLAQTGKKVLLIDADLENPGLGKLFRVETEGVPGISGLLSGQAGLKEAVKPSGAPNLTLLPAPAGSTDLSGVLSPAALKKWVGEAKSKFDFLLFDGVPLLVSPDAAVICAALDGVLLTARWGFTGHKDIQETVRRLQIAQVPLWGTLLNGVEKEPGPLWDLWIFPGRKAAETGHGESAKSKPADLQTS